MASPRPVDDPAPTGGGGDGSGLELCCGGRSGRSPRCQAAQAAINAAQTPTGDPAMPGVEALVPAMVTQVGGNTTWFEVTGSTARVRADLVCDGVVTRRDWITLTPDAYRHARPADHRRRPRPRRLRPGRPPAPDAGPAHRARRRGRRRVHVRQRPDVLLARPGAAGSGTPSAPWRPPAASPSPCTAEPVRLVVDPGNGDAAGDLHRRSNRCCATTSARAASPPARRAATATSTPRRWRRTGRRGPSRSPSPGTRRGRPPRAQAGDLGHVATTSSPRDLPVAEIQAVITHTEN